MLVVYILSGGRGDDKKKKIVHLYNYMVTIGCQLEWAHPILTGLFSDILFFIVPDIGGRMFVLI